VLQTWWHAPAGRYATEHDYEQHVLQWHLSHLGTLQRPFSSSAAPQPSTRSRHALPPGPTPASPRWPSRPTSTLQLKAMDDEFRHAVAHVDHTKASRRLGIFSAALIRAALLRPASEAERSLGGRGGSTRRGGGARGGVGGAKGDGHAAQGATGQLTGGAAGGDGPGVDVMGWPGAKQRASLRRLVALADASSPDSPAPAVVARLLRAAAKLLQPNAEAMNDLMRAPAGAVGTLQGVACMGGNGRLRLIEYNATSTALALLPTTGAALPPIGSPLSLRECVEVGSDVGRAQGTDAGAAAAAVGRAGDAQSWLQLEGGQLAMASRPSLCVRVGPGKAPKTPYSMLAQVGACAEHGSSWTGHGSAQTVGAVSLSLSLKPSLPEQEATQGSEVRVEGGAAGIVVRTSYSNAAVATALASAAAGTGIGGRGISESDARGRRLASSARHPRAVSGQATVRAPRDPLWQDGLMSAESVRGEQGDGALCLAAWRGKVADGAPLVWSACEPEGREGGRRGGKTLPPPLRWEAARSSASGAVRIRVAPRGSRALCLTADVVGAESTA
jgi:hypothetical protein